MNKITKHLKCRRCKKDFTLKTRQGRDPQYCSTECRTPSGPKIWNLVCRECDKEWSMVKPKNSGRKPHFCGDCHAEGKKKRHQSRVKDYKGRVRSRNACEETLVKWIPAEPLIKYLAQGHIKDEDWAIAASRDRSLINYMASKIGIQYTSMTRYMQPGAKINAYKGDEYAIRLRNTPYAYLGDGVL